MVKRYRNTGAIGAILDEYEKSLRELKTILRDVTDTELTTIVDSETKDPDCKSIQNILTHVIRAGYCYIIEIRRALGEKIDYSENKTFTTIKSYLEELDAMFQYNEQLFIAYPNLNIEETNPKKKITVRWGQQYDIEQLMEHTIVHILRHRRQIERFLIQLQHQ